ncbi:MAG: aminopeptidase P family N-terminal domain-containing protein [Granulosicoccaceae bacterium]
MSDVRLNFTPEEYALRLAKVRTAMAEQGIDTLVVHDPSNMAWLTGYDGWSFYTPQAVVVGASGEPLWYGRAMDANGARRTVYLQPENILSYPDHYVMNPPHHAMEHLATITLAERNWHTGSVGVEMDNYYFSATAYLALQDNLPQARIIDATGLVNWCRAVKSEQEINYMRVAARIAENMHRAAFDMIEPGLPKNQLVAEL